MVCGGESEGNESRGGSSARGLGRHFRAWSPSYTLRTAGTRYLRTAQLDRGPTITPRVASVERTNIHASDRESASHGHAPPRLSASLQHLELLDTRSGIPQVEVSAAVCTRECTGARQNQIRSPGCGTHCGTGHHGVNNPSHRCEMWSTRHPHTFPPHFEHVWYLGRCQNNQNS